MFNVYPLYLGCSRPALEAVACPSCYSPEEKISQQCYPGNDRMCYTCDDISHYSTILFAEHAVALITNHPSEVPLFLYLPLQDTHGPADVPAFYRNKFKDIPDNVRQELAGKMAIVDEFIKNVTDTLQTKNMLSNSIIVYTTDNGGSYSLIR